MPQYKPTVLVENTTSSMLINLMKPFLEIANEKTLTNGANNGIKISEANIKKDSLEDKSTQNQNIFSNLFSGKFDEIIKSATGNGIKSEEKKNSGEKTDKNGDDSNLLTSILNGKLNEVNWMNMILGNEKFSTHKDREEGNALAQLFNGSGSGFSKFSSLFGSGLDDDLSIPNRSSVKSNF